MIPDDIIKEFNQAFLAFTAYSDTLLENIGKTTKNLDKKKCDIITKKIPTILYRAFNPNKYVIKGSYGKGLQTRTPWVAIMDKEITTTTQKGVYIVFLMRTDLKGIFITLDQGTTVEGSFGVRTNSKDIKARTTHFRTILQLKNQYLQENDNVDVADARYKESLIYSYPWDLSTTEHKSEILEKYVEAYEKYKKSAPTIGTSSPDDSSDPYAKLIEKYKEVHKQNPFNGFEELYKWQLITLCQGKSNIEIAQIVYKNHKNLLYTSDASSLNRTILASEESRNKFSEILDKLFDETKDLKERLIEYKVSVKKNWPEEANLPDDNRSAAVFLACKYPNKYTVCIKNRVYNPLCQYLGVLGVADSYFYPSFMELIQPLVEKVSKDQELKDMIIASTPGCLQSDPLTAQTIIYTLLYRDNNQDEDEKEGDSDDPPIISLVDSDEDIEDGINIDTMKKTTEPRYWFYQPGKGGSLWKECYDNGVMLFGWDPIGDLKQYKTREEIAKAITEAYPEQKNPSNDSLANWNFIYGMKVGDIVYAKSTRTNLLGRGIITSKYYYDPTRSEFNKCRKVNWTHVGEWKLNDRTPIKTLTGIVSKDIIDSIEKIINTKEVDIKEPIKANNIIFYGAPGTGKSNKIDQEIKKVGKDKFIRTTFHPDSDYSTFVGCFKPVKDKETGKITYSFMPQAFVRAYIKAWQQKPSEPTYLVIEEINRGNCAQIFGDIFQLLDRNKDGESTYEIFPDSDLQEFLAETFDKEGIRVGAPADIINGSAMKLPNNLYIWATMNTSDQSLFPIDSAFKRRWNWEYTPISKGIDKDTHQPLEWKVRLNGQNYDWWEFLKAINICIEKSTQSEDKKLGYFFAVPSEEKLISAETFLGKVIFYIWNDVFKDLGPGVEPFTYNNTYHRFHQFFLDDGNPNEEELEAFMKGLQIKADVPENKAIVE